MPRQFLWLLHAPCSQVLLAHHAVLGCGAPCTRSLYMQRVMRCTKYLGSHRHVHLLPCSAIVVCLALHIIRNTDARPNYASSVALFAFFNLNFSPNFVWHNAVRQRQFRVQHNAVKERRATPVWAVPMLHVHCPGAGICCFAMAKVNHQHQKKVGWPFYSP